MRPSICLVCPTPLTIHFFFKKQIENLTKFADVTLITNLNIDEFTPNLNLPIRVISYEIFRQINLISDTKTLFWLWSHFLSNRYDLVWGIGPKGGLLSMLASKFSFIKVRLFIFQGEVWAAEASLRNSILKFIDKCMGKCATNLLAVSNSEKQFLISQGVVNPNKISVIGKGSISGVDTNFFFPAEIDKEKIRLQLGLPKHAYIFLFLGRIKRDKGIFELLAAFKKVLTTIPQAYLLIVGPDEDKLNNSIREYLINYPNNFSIHAFTENSRSYYQVADCFCLFSYREGFPISILEAGACGIPVIATKIYGNIDAIIDGKTGILVESKNINAMQGVMTYLATQKVRSRLLGCSARDFVKRNYHSDEVIRLYVDYIRKLLCTQQNDY